jgi:hypothetical protein
VYVFNRFNQTGRICYSCPAQINNIALVVSVLWVKIMSINSSTIVVVIARVPSLHQFSFMHACIRLQMPTSERHIHAVHDTRRGLGGSALIFGVVATRLAELVPQLLHSLTPISTSSAACPALPPFQGFKPLEYARLACP